MAEAYPETIPGGDNEGYDPNDDEETTGLLDKEKEEDRRKQREEYEMRHREPKLPPQPKYPPLPPQHTLKTSTSTSGSHETSFVDTPSGGILFVSRREQEKPEVEERIKDVYQNPNFKKFFSYKGDFDRIAIKLTRKDAKEYHLDNPSEFPKTLREALGKTREEVNQEKYEKQLEEEEKQAKRKQEREELRRKQRENKEKISDINERLINLGSSSLALKRARNNAETPEEAGEKDDAINAVARSMGTLKGELGDLLREDKELKNERENADARVEEGERLVETARERVNERLLSLRDRIKQIFKKYGFTVFSIATAIGVVIGVIVSNLKAGLTKVAKGVGDGMKALGKKLGEILPGMIGAIASFIFRTAGEVIGFLAKNAWLLVVGLVVLAIEQFKKKSK